MSKRRAEPYQGLGKNTLEYTKVVPKFLQAVSRPPPVPAEVEDNPELEEKEEKELIEQMMKEQKEEEEKRREFYAEKGGGDPNPRVVEPEPEPEPEDDSPRVDENGKILFKRPTKHKLDSLQKTKESKTKKSKVDIKKQIVPPKAPAPKKDTAAAKNTTLLSFEDDE